VTSLLEILYGGLLYFTSFAAVLTLFASAIATAFWVVTRMVHWLTADPQTEAKEREQMHVRRAEHLRAGQ
jgi:hypothetical protein